MIGFLVVMALFALTLAPQALWAEAVISVVNLDGPREGFNDPSAPDADSTSGGNDGATLGAQRLKAFQHAADLWGKLVNSSVPIKVDAQMDDLFCSSNSAVLGAAGPLTVHRDFTGAPISETWYPQALANSLAGRDLNDRLSDLIATFNSAVGTNCDFPIVWYYGLNGQAPDGTIDFVTVVMHEIGHGLGFLSLVDLASGQKFAGYDDAYMLHLKNNATGEKYADMTNEERVSASINTGNLHWDGANVVNENGGEVDMYAPSPQQSGSSVSHFSNTLSPDQVMEPSYTRATHDVGLALPLFKDIGWSTGEAGEGEEEEEEEQPPVPETPCGCNLPGAIVGTPERDILRGTSGDDIICGLEGNDVIYGYAGNDCIEGGAGRDRILGRSGDDTIYGGEGRDRIYGGSGNDTISGGEDKDYVNAGSGDDTVFGDAGNDWLRGSYGDDILSGDEGRDRLYGEKGNDTISGGEDRDYLRGGRGNDMLSGDDGRDWLRGGRGNDMLFGGADRDWLFGESGDDELDGGSGNDFCRGGPGDDTKTDC